MTTEGYNLERTRDIQKRSLLSQVLHKHGIYNPTIPQQLLDALSERFIVSKIKVDNM